MYGVLPAFSAMLPKLHAAACLVTRAARVVITGSTLYTFQRNCETHFLSLPKRVPCLAARWSTITFVRLA